MGKVSLSPGAPSLVYTQPREQEGWLLAGTHVLGEQHLGLQEDWEGRALPPGTARANFLGERYLSVASAQMAAGLGWAEG